METSIANLQYADAANSLIEMNVTIGDDLANKFFAAGVTVPFCLSTDDKSPVSVAVRELINGGSYNIAAYVAPPPPAEPDFGSVPPSLVASILDVVVSDGDVSSINGAYNIIAATYDSLGLYTFYLINPQPDTNYYISSSGVILHEVDKQTDYLTVEALSDANGSRFDPSHFGVNLYRV